LGIKYNCAEESEIEILLMLSLPGMEGPVLEHHVPPAPGVRELDRGVFIPSKRAGGAKHKYCTLPSPAVLFSFPSSCAVRSVADADNPFLENWVMLTHCWPLLLECCCGGSPHSLWDAAAHACLPYQPWAAAAASWLLTTVFFLSSSASCQPWLSFYCLLISDPCLGCLLDVWLLSSSHSLRNEL